MNGVTPHISPFLIINGVEMPLPCPDFEITRSQLVDSGRNANGAVVGQLIGRKLWKINNLHWKGLTPETWNMIQNAIEPFFVPVTFTGDDNERHTVTMYPSDTSGKPYHVTDVSYDFYEDCKFNLIDCGW